MAEQKDLPRSATIGDAMLLLSPLELPPEVGSPPASCGCRVECPAM